MISNYNEFIFESLLADIEMIEFSSRDLIKVFTDIDILESIVIDSGSLLRAIDAQKISIFEEYTINNSIEDLYDNQDFNKKLGKLKLKKSILSSSEESETFIDKNIVLKYFTVYEKDKSELDQPKYIFFQSSDKGKNNWSDVTCYEVKESMTNFYNKLTNKTIELKKDDKTYIYNTSNVNDWILQNSDDANDVFKPDMSRDDIKAILKDKKNNTTIKILP